MEGLTQEQIRKEAQELYRAERERTVLRPFTEKYPKIEPGESYRIQLALIEMKRADGAKVVGKKIGLTSKAMQKMLNVDQPDYGHILDGMVLQDGVVFRRQERNGSTLNQFNAYVPFITGEAILLCPSCRSRVPLRLEISESHQRVLAETF